MRSNYEILNSARLKGTSYSCKYKWRRKLFALELSKNTVILNFVKKKHTHTHTHTCIYRKTFIFQQGDEKEFTKKILLPLWIRMVSICAPVSSLSSSIDFSLGRRVIMIAEGLQWFEFLCIFFRITAGVLF